MSFSASATATLEEQSGRTTATTTMRQVTVNLVDRSLRYESGRISLTPGEFSLLMFFLRARGRALARDEIIEHVRGGDSPVTARSVDVRIAGLRRKLRPLGKLIDTVRGAGYLFRDESALAWHIGDDFAGARTTNDDTSGG